MPVNLARLSTGSEFARRVPAWKQYFWLDTWSSGRASPDGVLRAHVRVQEYRISSARRAFPAAAG